MSPTSQDRTTLELDTAVLEKIFIGVACLVVLLLGVLVLVLTKNRYKQSSFKLLDNAGKLVRHIICHFNCETNIVTLIL